MSDKLLQALGQLDPSNDNHWTADGLPRLDTVKLLTGNQSVSRTDITKAAPTFSRDKPLVAATPAPVEPKAEQAVPVVPDPVEPTPAATQAEQEPDIMVDEQEGVLDGIPEEVEEDELLGDFGDDAELDELQAHALDDAELTDALGDIQGMLRSNARILATAKQREARLYRHETVVIEEQEKRKPKAQGNVAVKEYLASQKKMLERRAERINAMKGTDLSALLDGVRGSKIDQAFARKNTRGARRPVR